MTPLRPESRGRWHRSAAPPTSAARLPMRPLRKTIPDLGIPRRGAGQWRVAGGGNHQRHLRSDELLEGLGVTFGPSAHDDFLTTGALTAIISERGVLRPRHRRRHGALLVATANGVPGTANTQITLSSGALLTLNEDGTFTYEPGTASDTLRHRSGASNTTATDTFTYSLAGGSGRLSPSISIWRE